MMPKHLKSSCSFRLFAAWFLKLFNPSYVVSLILGVVLQEGFDGVTYTLRVPLKSFPCLQFFVSCQLNILEKMPALDLVIKRATLLSSVGVVIQLRSARYQCNCISYMSLNVSFVVSPSFRTDSKRSVFPLFIWLFRLFSFFTFLFVLWRPPFFSPTAKHLGGWEGCEQIITKWKNSKKWRDTFYLIIFISNVHINVVQYIYLYT